MSLEKEKKGQELSPVQGGWQGKLKYGALVTLCSAQLLFGPLPVNAAEGNPPLGKVLSSRMFRITASITGALAIAWYLERTKK